MDLTKFEWLVRWITYSSQSPIFKGSSLCLIALCALAFAWWRKERGEKLQGGFLVFSATALFILLFGLFLLIFQPHWWNPPY
jgi:hypothetical protein